MYYNVTEMSNGDFNVNVLKDGVYVLYGTRSTEEGAKRLVKILLKKANDSIDPPTVIRTISNN